MIRFDELDQYSFDYDIQMVVRVVESEEGEWWEVYENQDLDHQLYSFSDRFDESYDTR